MGSKQDRQTGYVNGELRYGTYVTGHNVNANDNIAHEEFALAA